MLSLVTGPATEPVTVAEARRQLLLNSSEGEPVPPAPTAVLAAAGVGLVDDGIHKYLWTFVTADGETSAGDISAPVTVADKSSDGKVAVSVPIGGSACTSRKGYRTSAGGAVFGLFVTVADNTTITTTDNIADSALGAAPPTTNTTADPEITRWLSSCRLRAERVSRRALITQVWNLVLDVFPSCGYIHLPKPPLISVGSITYLDTDGASQTFAASKYVVEIPAGPFAQHGKISLAYNEAWPSLYGQANDVTVQFTAGYGAAGDVPAMLKDGILLDIATRSSMRENLSVGAASPRHVPGTANEIYRAFRVWAPR